MFGEFNEAAQPKTSLARYSIEFNYLAVKMHPHRIAYLRLLGKPYTLLYVRRSVSRLNCPKLDQNNSSTEDKIYGHYVLIQGGGVGLRE